MRIVRRSEVVLADLGKTLGHEQAKIRPAIVIQENVSNTYSPISIIVPLTTNLQEKERVSNVLIYPAKNGLLKPSVVLTNQIRAVDKTRILKSLGFLSDEDMARVDNALHRILALD